MGHVGSLALPLLVEPKERTASINRVHHRTGERVEGHIPNVEMLRMKATGPEERWEKMVMLRVVYLRHLWW